MRNSLNYTFSLLSCRIKNKSCYEKKKHFVIVIFTNLIIIDFNKTLPLKSYFNYLVKRIFIIFKLLRIFLITLYISCMIKGKCCILHK